MSENAAESRNGWMILYEQKQKILVRNDGAGKEKALSNNKTHLLPLGSVEPHAAMLTTPPAEQLIYKMMTVENFLKSTVENYLHFNRVDSYKDFPEADQHDGAQLPKDHEGNLASSFDKDPNFSAAHYYNQSRGRTYACCFSLEYSDFIRSNYANGSTKGKVCIAINFGKLRGMLNDLFELGKSAITYNHKLCHQIFSINYGLIEYIEMDIHRENTERLTNPIKYTYLKDKIYQEEKELRVSLSAFGLGQFVCGEDIIGFPNSLHVPFNFKDAIERGVIQQILTSQVIDNFSFLAELSEFSILPKGSQ